MKGVLITDENISNIDGKVIRFFGSFPSEVTVSHTFGGGFTKNPKDVILEKDGGVFHSRRNMDVAKVTMQVRRDPRDWNKKYSYIHIQYVDDQYSWAMHTGDRIYIDSNIIMHQDASPFYHVKCEPFNNGPLYMTFQKK